MGKQKDKEETKKVNTRISKQKNDSDAKDKSKIKENILTGIVVLIMLAVAVFGLWKLSGESEKPANTLVFTVGTEEVYLDEVNLCVLQNMLSLGIAAEDMQNTTAEDGTGAADHYKQAILELIMDYKVAYMVAKEQGLSLTEEEKEQVRLDVVGYLGEVDARLLNAWGIEQERIEEVYMQRYLAHKLEETVTGEIQVDDQNYCTIYLMLFPKIEMLEDGNYATLEDGETPIMLSDEEIKQAKENADNAWKELQEGADVVEIAEKYNVQSFSGEESNLADSFDEPFKQYTKSLKENEYSPVLETESCYAIVKMVKENNAEIAEQILSYYKEDLKKEALEEQRTTWYEEMGIGQEPVYNGKIWDKLSLYDYVQ